MNHSLSHLKKSLNPTVPVLPMGIFRYFWAVAYVCIGASPNEVLFNFTAILIPIFHFVNSLKMF